MTSISSLTTQLQRPSPRDILQTELKSQISTGEVAAEDEDALTTALNTIDSQLSASRPGAGSAPPSPEQMQAKIDDLIAEQVASGDLTEEQAAELSDIFSDAFAGGPGGGGGPGGAGGPPPSPPPGGPEQASSSEDNSATDVADMLAEFLKQLQEQQGVSSYGSDGESGGSSSDSLLFDFAA